MGPEVLCIGHCCQDLSVFLDDYPEENSKSETRELLESGGGPAANAAYLLSVWGVRTGFAGLVGDDPYGERIRRDFAQAGTDLTLFEVRPRHESPVSVILINRRNGSRTIVNRKVSSAQLELNHAVLANLRPKVLLVDGHEPRAAVEAIEAFPEATSILDAGSWREGTAELANRVDYLAASERFARQAVGLPHDHDSASRRACLEQLRDRYPRPRAIIVTLGEKGLVFESGGIFDQMPAFPVRAVDTTAAGDIFHGALAYVLLRSAPLPEALRFASMTAALSVTKPGGRQSIPSISSVQEALTSC